MIPEEQTLPEAQTPQERTNTRACDSAGRTRCTHERVRVRASVPVSASGHGKPSTYGQKHESLCRGTARDHDLLHRDDPSEVHEAMVGLAHACSVGILVGVVVVVVEFLV